LTVELSLLLSGISVAFAIFFGISSKNRNDRKDTEQETEDRASTHTLLMTKLENIADDVKDIKRDYRETNAEVQNLRERVVAVEQSLKSYHKRLDGIKTDQ
jgi:peptidoglycan hydrolase CwlO-like protein